MRARPDDPAATSRGPVVATGLLFAGDLIFWHLAILNTTVANATFFATTAPVWVVVFGWLLYRKRVGCERNRRPRPVPPRRHRPVGQSFAIAPERLARRRARGGDGDLLRRLFHRRREGARAPPRGARDILHDRSVALRSSRWRRSARHGSSATGCVPADLRGWVVLLALAWMSHVGGQGLLAVALGSLPAMFSSLVIFLESLAAALLGWLVLSEAVTPLQADRRSRHPRRHLGRPAARSQIVKGRIVSGGRSR